MQLHGQQLIGFSTSSEGKATLRARDPERRRPLDPPFHEATEQEIDRAMRLAARAHRELRRQPRLARAALLEDIAARIEDLGEALLERTHQETALPMARLTMERGRTVGQLRMFANVVREGAFLQARIDHAQPNRQPLPKPDVRQLRVAVGPVVVFGASNFPLAFSVAGGDTASALAAGCPVVAKAHPHHPGTSEMIGRAIGEAVREADLPEGTFSLLQGAGHEVGLALVRHPAARSVGFTGSLTGGRALFDAAAARPQPIPVHAEMGSVNPVFLLPDAMRAHAEELADGLRQSTTLGVGQFCTNPGVVVALESDATSRMVERLGHLMTEAPTGTTLHDGIAEAYRRGLHELLTIDGVRRVGREDETAGSRAVPAMLTASAAVFLANPLLREEVFGPCTLVVLCPSAQSMADVAASFGGQLTATLHATTCDVEECAALIETLEDRVGRLLFNGFPTGVEVCPSMHHGGPYPATTDARSTSVGSAAIERFVRPLCYQDAPPEVLPSELRDGNPEGILRFVDGELRRH